MKILICGCGDIGETLARSHLQRQKGLGIRETPCLKSCGIQAGLSSFLPSVKAGKYNNLEEQKRPPKSGLKFLW